MTQTRNKTDRRTRVVSYDPRSSGRGDGEFHYRRTVYLGDTQVMGGCVYFGTYWHFIGDAREEFLRFLLGNSLVDFMSSGVNLITANCAGSYLQPLFAYDEIQINVLVKKVGKVKLELAFEILKLNGDHCFHAGMTLAPMIGKKPVPWPEVLLKPLKKLEKSYTAKNKSAAA